MTASLFSAGEIREHPGLGKKTWKIWWKAAHSPFFPSSPSHQFLSEQILKWNMFDGVKPRDTQPNTYNLNNWRISWMLDFYHPLPLIRKITTVIVMVLMSIIRSTWKIVFHVSAYTVMWTNTTVGIDQNCILYYCIYTCIHEVPMNAQ